MKKTSLLNQNKMSQFDNIKNHEMETVEQFRMRMKNAVSDTMLEDPFLFYRFLKARDFDIEKAEDMLRKHLAVRKVHKLDTKLQDFTPKEAFKYIDSSYIGEDKEGNLVIYVPGGKIDIRDVINCFKMEDYFDHWIWANEREWARFKEANKKSGKCTWKFTIIFDLDGFKLSNAIHSSSAAYLSRMFESYQDNYPETLNYLFVINAPSYFMLIFSIVKKVIAKEVLRKIYLYGTSGWKAHLLEIIDSDVLPEFLGGSRTDPDGNSMCTTFVNHAGKIPSKYHLSKEARTFKDKTRVQNITISPKTSREIFVEVKESGCIIEYEFEVKNKDIHFALYFKESDGKLIEALPSLKYETPNGTFEASYKCQCIGTYVIVFDNTYSWLNSKEVSYCITVKKSTT